MSSLVRETITTKPAGRRLAEALWAKEYGPEHDEDIDWSNVEFEPIILPVDASEGGEVPG
jgi:hypothetical protein